MLCASGECCGFVRISGRNAHFLYATKASVMKLLFGSDATLSKTSPAATRAYARRLQQRPYLLTIARA